MNPSHDPEQKPPQSKETKSPSEKRTGYRGLRLVTTIAELLNHTTTVEEGREEALLITGVPPNRPAENKKKPQEDGSRNPPD